MSGLEEAEGVDEAEEEPSEVWDELDEVPENAKTLVLSKIEGFGSHRFVDGRLGDRWSSLTLLDLSGCGLERAGDRLCRLSQLRDLNLSGNALGPALEPGHALVGLTHLRSLDVSSNGLEALPRSIVSLEALESLNASCNRLTTLAMVDHAGLPRLRTANLAGNEIRQIVPAAHGLRILNVSDNALDSLDGLAGSSDLVELDASNNSLEVLPEAEDGGGLPALCPKLKAATLRGNPWRDKKFKKAAESGGEALQNALRSGKSKRQAKREAKAAKPPPERLFVDDVGKEAPAPVPPPPAAKVKGKGKKKKEKQGSGGGAAAQPQPPPPRPANPQIRATRRALVARPHVFACVLKVVDQRTRHQPVPFCFAPAESRRFTSAERCAFESVVGLHEALSRTASASESAPPGDGGGGDGDDMPTRAALRAIDRLKAFLALQTTLHSTVGEKRRAGSIGTHDASQVAWPLTFVADRAADIDFLPLAVGWMESKGRRSVASYATGVVDGSTFSADAHLKAHAKKVLRSQSDACALRDEIGTVLSVPPLSNGWETRCAADTGHEILLEGSSDGSDGGAAVRRMLLDLIQDFIADVETSAPNSGGCVVLVQPVDVVCDWDRRLVRGTFPEESDFDEFPALPSRGEAPSDSDSDWGSDSDSNSESESSSDADSDSS